jgi:hypothetical protein
MLVYLDFCFHFNPSFYCSGLVGGVSRLKNAETIYRFFNLLTLESYTEHLKFNPILTCPHSVGASDYPLFDHLFIFLIQDSDRVSILSNTKNMPTYLRVRSILSSEILADRRDQSIRTEARTIP